jgi:hypothetical protein
MVPAYKVAGSTLRAKAKIKWHVMPQLYIKAYVDVAPRGYETGLSEEDMDPIQEWCKQTNCGVRTSFDMFKFKNKKEITMFLLRWG